MPKLGHLYYEEYGSGDPVVMIHGHTLDRRMWEDCLPLADQFRLILLDVPGHGKSDIDPEGKPLGQSVAALLDHLGVHRAVICGLSMGGSLTINFATHNPERVRALVLVDAALQGHAYTDWPGGASYMQIARTQGLQPALEAWMADPVFAPARKSACADRLCEIVSAFPGPSWVGKTPSLYYPGTPDTERISSITAPTLVLVGEHDLPDFHRIADRLAGEIPGARLETVPDCGHLLPMEQPATFRTTLRLFLEQLKSK